MAGTVNPNPFIASKTPALTGEEIKEIREAWGRSQTAFAELMGVHWITVNRWENGHQTPLPAHVRIFNQVVKEHGK